MRFLRPEKTLNPAPAGGLILRGGFFVAWLQNQPEFVMAGFGFLRRV